VTAYDVDGYFIPNSLSRYEVEREREREVRSHKACTYQNMVLTKRDA